MFVDRAEWEWFRDQHLAMHMKKRKMQFCGNINLGECILLTLDASGETVNALHHRISMLRSLDDCMIADIETVKDLKETGNNPE